VAASASDATLDVWMFDVGQGACVLVDCPDWDRPILVDCGSTTESVNTSYDDIAASAAALIDSLGDPAVVISHGDKDHYSLVPDIVPPDRTEAVFLGGRRADFLAPAKGWLDAAEAAGAEIVTFPRAYFGPRREGLECGSASVDILSANATLGTPADSKNGNSIVLAVTYGDVTVVLPGDAEGATETHALANKDTIGRLASTQAVIVGSHHGARTSGSNGSAWAAAWAPITTIFSMAPPAYGHPQCEVVKRYEGYMPRWGTPHYLTCGEGRRVTRARVETRMLSTHQNGTLLLRIRPTRMMIYCARRTEPCSGDLPTAGA
jgi:beta-lactamase superfamily II metal-dependent hydrolase